MEKKNKQKGKKETIAINKWAKEKKRIKENKFGMRTIPLYTWND